MVWHRRGRLAIALMVAVGIAAAPGASALADPTVTGDPAAWSDILAAYAKLSLLSGFRMKMTMKMPDGAGGMPSKLMNGMTATVEVAPPGKMHMTMQMAPGAPGMEMIRVGDAESFRLTAADGTGEWQCIQGGEEGSSGKAPPALNSPQDPQKVTGTVEVSRGQDTIINDKPVQTYTYAYAQGTGDGQALKTTLYVDVESGIPMRSVQLVPLDRDVNAQMTFDFYDFGAQIDITLPQCSAAPDNPE